MFRRVQSMSGPPGHMPSSCDRSQIKARLDVALSSPRARPVSPGGEQIYAPVAALQQKIQVCIGVDYYKAFEALKKHFG